MDYKLPLFPMTQVARLLIKTLKIGRIYPHKLLTLLF